MKGSDARQVLAAWDLVGSVSEGRFSSPWHSQSQEDRLFTLGKSLTEALSSEPGSRRQAEGMAPDVVDQVVALSGADWSVCLERYVDLPR